MSQTLDTLNTTREDNRYDGWAMLYDQTMGPKYVKEQLAMLDRILLPNLPNKARLFDLCCGTGQLIKHLLQRGYQVTGLDSSKEMLECAKTHAPSAEFVLEDACQFSRAGAFDAAFSTSASLNHLESIEDLEKIFGNVCDSLTQHGTFVFDLNHPGQLEKWWRGKPAEGQITHSCAWMVTPRYDSNTKRGAFRVTMWKRPKAQSLIAFVKTATKAPLYHLLGLRRFIGLRLKVIERFGDWESDWEKQEMDFPVIGHDLNEVRAALRSAGFASVKVETIDGRSEVDDDHSAHFICKKSVDNPNCRHVEASRE